MDISVIIPHYNLEPALLQRAITSAAGQFDGTGVEWEIIVVDDGSDTPPTTVVQEFHQADIRLYCRPHARQGAARNYGLQQAQGEYILFLDADDYLLPHSLSPVLNLALTSRSDIVRFLISGITVHNIPAIKNHISAPLSGDEFMRLHHLPDSPVCYLFRRLLATDNNITFPENVFLEDCAFTFKLHHAASSVVQTDYSVYAYCQRETSTVHTFDARHKEQLRQHHRLMLEEISRMIADNSDHSDKRGLQRKRTFLTVDYIIRICRERPWSTIDDERQWLTRQELYPLPCETSYGWKYLAFATLANTKLGLRLIKLRLNSD